MPPQDLTDSQKLDRLLTGIYGTEGQGGLHRWVHDLADDQKKMAATLNKMVGAVIIIPSVIGIITFLVTLLVNQK